LIDFCRLEQSAPARSGRLTAGASARICQRLCCRSFAIACAHQQRRRNAWYVIAAAASRANAGRMDTRAGGAAVSSADSAHSFAHIGSRRFARADKKQTTEDGFDATFATNTLGTFLMTVLLVPWLHECAVTAGEPSRVITVSSGGMLVRKLASGSLRCLSPCYSRTAAPRHSLHRRKRCASLIYSSTSPTRAPKPTHRPRYELLLLVGIPTRPWFLTTYLLGDLS